MPEAKLSFSRSTEYFSLTLANCNSSLRPSDAMKRARIFYFIDEWHEGVQKRECSGIYRRQNQFPFDRMLHPAKLVRQLEVGVLFQIHNVFANA